jgi:hypothetical protein
VKQINYDFLEKCTKEELINAIRQSGWIRQAFKYSDILFDRWQKKSKDLQEKRRLNHEFLQSLDGKAQDDLARQFNDEKDLNKRIRIINKMKPYQKKFDKWKKEYDCLCIEEKKLDKLYESIDIQRQKES